MRRLAVIAAVIGIIAVTSFLLIGSPRETLQSVRDARALAALPHRALGPMLELESGSPDFVVFQDGADGWFEVDPRAVPATLEIGFHGPRLIDILGSGRHVSTYCGGSGRPGKIIWIIRDAQIAHDFAFCNPRRMDLGPLRPYGTPVEMVTDTLPRDALLARQAEIAADPARAVVSSPEDMTEFTQRIVVTPPLMWYVRGQAPFQHEVEDAIEARILAHMGTARVDIRPQPNSNANPTYPDAEGNGADVTGMAIAIDGVTGIVPGVWAQPSEIWIDCVPESCARVETLSFDGLFDGARDIGALRTALQGWVENPTPEGSPTPLEWYPTWEEVEDDTVDVAAPTMLTYDLRYIVRAQSE